ncbi:MAG: hypothetical protein AAGK05_12795 [Pseudomonadota bacterium]
MADERSVHRSLEALGGGWLAQATGEIIGPHQPANKFDGEFVGVPGDYFFHFQGRPVVTGKRWHTL